MSPIEGYKDYERREYCKSVECPIQLDMEAVPEGTAAYENLRNTCTSACRHTTYEFHHWLIDEGYLIVKPTG